MSHTITFQTKIQNREALEITCQRLGLKLKDRKQHKTRHWGIVDGVSVQLPGWVKEIPIDLTTGKCYADNYSSYWNENNPEVKSGKKELGQDGKWGNIEELYRLCSEYAATEVMLKANEEGHIVSEYGWDEATKQVRMSITT